LGLLPQKPNAVEHLLRPRTGSLELGPQLGILLLETRHLGGQFEANDPALMPFQFLETCLSREGASSKAGEFVSEVMHKRTQFANCGIFSLFFV
jgi:hypothetical protein